MTNLKFQLEQVGLSERFDVVLEECARIREELGWPIMITPFSQLVGTQAVLNVVNAERYRVVPNEVKKYVLGYYGKLLAKVDGEAMDRIVANGSRQIALQPQPLAPAVAALRKHYPNAGDDELLLRFQLPGAHVDAMRAAQPMDHAYSASAPIVELVRRLIQRRKPGRVYVRKGEAEVSVTSRVQRIYEPATDR